MNDREKLSDEEIVKKIRAGGRELYAIIIERYQNRLLRYVMYLLNDEYKAADAVQEALIKAFVNLNSFNASMKFSSWIYRITHNEAMNAVAKYKREIPMPEDTDFESEENIEDAISREEIKEMTHKCLAQMPVLYSEPLMLFFLEERSYEEISDILRIPIGTVGTRINRAKALMKKICQTIQK
jgi:RNA polymerase sigma-70 factor, ECF subfamily